MSTRKIAFALLATLATPALADDASDARAKIAAAAQQTDPKGGEKDHISAKFDPEQANVSGEVKLEKVRELGSKTAAIAFDAETGLAYQRAGFGDEPAATLLFDGGEAFDAFKPVHKFEFQKADVAGTYIAARGGLIYGQAFGEALGSKEPTGAIAAWGGKEGDLQALRESLPDLGKGEAGGMDWGGFTNVNFLADNTGTYVLGNHGDGVWLLYQMKGLDVVNARKFEAKSIGFAFMMNGTLFTGASASEPVVTSAFNFEGDRSYDVKFVLAGLSGGQSLITGTAYDFARDRLYFSDSGSGTLFAVGGASKVFAVNGGGGGGGGGGVGAVPEPASWALLIAGFGLVGGMARRRRLAGIGATV